MVQLKNIQTGLKMNIIRPADVCLWNLQLRVQARGLLGSTQGRRAGVDESHPAAAAAGWE